MPRPEDPVVPPAPEAPVAPVAPAPEPEAPVAPDTETPVEGAGIVPDGHQLSAADDPSVDSTVNQGTEDLGPAVWMEHDGVDGKTQTTQVQFDTVWAPRGWTLTDAPVEEIGSVPGA
jgi:hypothetical protein